MPPSSLSHRRTHNLLLISKLLSLRDGASPLTLILDSLEQSSTPLLKEYIRRAKLSRSHVIFVSFETFARPAGVDTFVTAREKELKDVAREVIASYPSSEPAQGTKAPAKRCLVIIDSANGLASRKGANGGPVYLPEYLSSLIGASGSQIHISLLVVFHQDQPMLQNLVPYTPSPLSLLTYLATTIISVHSMEHILSRKAAVDRSLIPPVFGLEEELDGVIIGRMARRKILVGHEGIVLEMEHRRKSGRGISEWYFLPSASRYHQQQATEVVILLDDHPLYKGPKDRDGGEQQESEEPQSTFDLGLTDRQRRERDNVVLPYFDAQKGAGPGEGGRILYDMGEEDDFDEEEDEI